LISDLRKGGNNLNDINDLINDNNHIELARGADKRNRKNSKANEAVHRESNQYNFKIYPILTHQIRCTCH
jgi:hypothetical protein